MFWDVLRIRPFARLFGAASISEIGSKIHRIALLVLVYTLTQDALWVSLTLGVQLAATIAIAPLISPWVELRERRRVLVSIDLLRMALVALIPLIGIHSLPVLLMLTFCNEVLRSIYNPVSLAVIPHLLPEDKMDTANGLMLFAERFAEVAFVGLAGLLVALIGPVFAFWVDSVTYLASALMLLGLPSIHPEHDQLLPYWARVREGIGFVVRQPVIRAVVGTLFVAAVFGTTELVLGVVLAVGVLHVGSTGFGVMEAAMAGGAIVGTILMPNIMKRIPRERLLLFGLLVFGLFIASVGAVPVFAWAVVAYAVSGVVNMAFIVPFRSLLQLNTPPELRARTFASVGAIMNSALLVGTLVSGLLERQLGVTTAFLVAGSVIMLVALVTMALGGIASRKGEASPAILPSTHSAS